MLASRPGVVQPMGCWAAATHLVVRKEMAVRDLQPRSLPSARREAGGGTGKDKLSREGKSRAEHIRTRAETDRVSARAPSRMQIIRVRHYSDVRVLLSVWLCDHRLHSSVSAAVDRARQSTYESQLARDRGAAR